jgi:hypothetical protein
MAKTSYAFISIQDYASALESASWQYNENQEVSCLYYWTH